MLNCCRNSKLKRKPQQVAAAAPPLPALPLDDPPPLPSEAEAAAKEDIMAEALRALERDSMDDDDDDGKYM